MLITDDGELWAKVFVIGDEAVANLVAVTWPAEAGAVLDGVEGQAPGWTSTMISLVMPFGLVGRTFGLHLVAYELGLFGARTEEIRKAATGYDAIVLTYRPNARDDTERIGQLAQQIVDVPSPVQALEQQPSRVVWLDGVAGAAPPGFELMVELGPPVVAITSPADWWLIIQGLGREIALDQEDALVEQGHAVGEPGN